MFRDMNGTTLNVLRTRTVRVLDLKPTVNSLKSLSNNILVTPVAVSSRKLSNNKSLNRESDHPRW